MTTTSYLTYLDAIAVRTSLAEFAFGARVLGGRHHLHGLRDLLNVGDGLQTYLDLFERGHGTGVLLLDGGAGAAETGEKTKMKTLQPNGRH